MIYYQVKPEYSGRIITYISECGKLKTYKLSSEELLISDEVYKYDVPRMFLHIVEHPHGSISYINKKRYYLRKER